LQRLDTRGLLPIPNYKTEKRFSDIIRQNRERIVQEWCDFASEEIEAARRLNGTDVEDHLQEMLVAIAADMETPQSEIEQSAKARGQKTAETDELQPAKQHGIQRVLSGFSISESSSEFRALRASVLRAWEEDRTLPISEVNLQELIRFNEAVDEAWMESVKHFHRSVQESKDWLIGVLGHDLRTPLAALAAGMNALARSNNLSEEEREIIRIGDSSIQRMHELINNSLEMTRVRLGNGLHLNKRPINLGDLCHALIQELQLAHPGSNIRVICESNVEGMFDVDRLHQVVSNLVNNALRHGASDHPVTVRIANNEDAAVLSVHNEGSPIDQDTKDVMFRGMLLNGNGSNTHSYSVGLGLYIVRQIVTAHGGRVEVESTREAGTTFTVRLPLS